MNETELKEIKVQLRAVLLSVKGGISAEQVPSDYQLIVGDSIPYRRLGFQTFEDFILAIPDVARLERRGNEVIIHGVADESTAHIKALVSKQRSKKVKKPVRRRRGGPSTAKFPPRPAKAGQSGPYRKAYPGTPRQHVPRHGVPSFISPPRSNKLLPLTPVTISIGNVASGTRTIRVGSNVMFNKAMADANKDSSMATNRPQQQSPRFEVPPRFRRKMGGMPSPQQPQQQQPPPVKRLAHSKHASMTDGGEYIAMLSQYLREINQPLRFETTEVANGYVSSISINKNIYGSEDIYQTAGEAESAAAKNAVLTLNVAQKQQDSGLPPIDWEDTGMYRPVLNWADEMTREESGGSSLPREQLLKIKSRIKEIIESKKNGLWGTRIPHEYKDRYNEEPPADLMDLIKQWKDVARVEPVPNTDRELVYPVTEDPNRVNQQNDTRQSVDRHNQSSAVTTVKQNSIDKSAVKSPSSPGVKDLYGLYVDTQDKQLAILKNLEIPRELLINSDDPVEVYMTYLHNPGFFCVQREDSVIDSISENLQTYCKSVSCPPADELVKGRFCAALFSGDGCWTRAEIQQHKDNGTVEVLFVDYGNVEYVKEQDVRWLSPDLARHPCQVVNCSLFGIQPLKGESEWGEAALKLFAELVQDEALLAIPQSISDKVVDVVLYLKSDTNLSINEKLIEAGVAIETKVEEDSVHPADLVLPEEKEWDVHVTYISSSTESVMLRLVGEEFSDKLDAYQSRLQEAFRKSSADTQITEGLTYVAYDDGLYHRVRVISQDGKKVQCYFLDHGDTDELIPDQLQLIDPQINKLLPYQAVEVSLYGLENVSNNITSLEKICDLALGKTLVAEVVEREDLPSVILYDTSGDNDININEIILRTVEAEGGGISTPKTESQSPGNSASSTPQRVLSPIPGDTKLSSAIGDSKSIDKLDSNANPVIRNISSDNHELPGWVGPSVITDLSANKSPPSQQLSPNLSQLSLNSDTSVNSDISMRSKSSEVPENIQSVSRPILGRSSSGKDSVPTLPNDNDSPKPFQIPPVGEYLDVHVNFVHDPSNFVCIPYEEMNNLEQLLLDMMDFYKTPLKSMSRSDISPGSLYAGVKDDIWYRVKVSDFVAGSDLLSVYLVDIGEYSVMMLSELQPLVQQFCKLPMMAFHATLGSIVPESGMWYEAAKYKFIELAREKDLIGLVQGFDENTGVVNLSLIDTSKDSVDICIDEVLVNSQYANFK